MPILMNSFYNFGSIALNEEQCKGIGPN